jgi:TRAP-type C4-dicarboxylate transport system permease large subunit
MPLVIGMGWNIYWFGVIMVMCMLIGLITPPVGMSVYVMAGVSKTPLGTVFKGSMPYLVCLIVALAALVYIEPLSTWLPGITKGV